MIGTQYKAMKPKWTFPVLLLLLAIIGIQFYQQLQQQKRIERLEASLHGNPHSMNTPSSARSKDQLTPDIRNPDPFSRFPGSDPFGFDTDPFADFERMRQRMDQILGSALDGDDWFSMRSPLSAPAIPELDNPKINIAEESDHFVITVTQVEPESQNIDANIDGRQLTLTFTTKHSSKENRSDDTGSFSGYSRSTRQFTRSVQLPEPVDVSSMQTRIEDDRIVITLRKTDT